MNRQSFSEKKHLHFGAITKSYICFSIVVDGEQKTFSWKETPLTSLVQLEHHDFFFAAASMRSVSVCIRRMFSCIARFTISSDSILYFRAVSSSVRLCFISSSDLYRSKVRCTSSRSLWAIILALLSKLKRSTKKNTHKITNSSLG